jgi:hypothetical protein
MNKSISPSRLTEISSGFQLLGLPTSQESTCSCSAPAIQLCTLLRPIDIIQRSNSTYHEIIDAQLEHHP